MSEQVYAMPRAQRPAAPPQGISRRGAAGGPSYSGALRALGYAGACVVALALTWVIAELVPAARVRDATTLRDFIELGGPRIDNIASFVVRLLNPSLFILWGIALVAIAVYRERSRVAIAVVAVMGFAPLTSEKLKPLLALGHPHVRANAEIQIGAASWPSGHSTAAMALSLCFVLVAPRKLRIPAAIIAAAFALGCGVALLILAWHMPSDVLGGYLIAALWTALAVAALQAAEARWPTGRPPV